ncbi:MAG: hypothetical protein C5B44_02375 [Acidobacteria bacterium]|nr:MAG: hypothetical protein C5B44_02375 [Acidobacteriota bacterium]
MMGSWTPTERRIGMWSAIAIVIISASYITTGIIWLRFSVSGVGVQGLEPSEPFLSILETLILLVTPALVALFAALHAYAPPERNTCSRIAFAFAVLLAGITGVVHFVQLTAIRRTANKTITEVFALYDPNSRLTPTLAADLVAWDFFLGFGLLFAAPIFRGDKLNVAIRGGLTLSGLLCLAGVSGPASGDMRFQYPAIVGYAFVFPFVCLLLAILFARSYKSVS